MQRMEDLPVKKVNMEQLAASEPGLDQPVKTEAVPPAAVEKAAAAARETPPAAKVSPSVGELLKRLEDPTRITRIEKIAAGNGSLTVEIRGADGRSLRQFDIALNPETRKVNIILDVKS